MRLRAALTAVSFLTKQPIRNTMLVSTRLLSSSSGSPPPQIQHVQYEQMEEIIEDYEEGGREDSQYVVIDVRNPDEIAYTGKLSSNTLTMPLPVILQTQAFQMDEDDFEELFGFTKPQLDETLVFSCAAGIRSVYACKEAGNAGYTKLVNYMGGANEWFQKS